LLGELVQPAGDTAAGLARRVGIKRQLVNYHLRELEKAGLIEVLERRQRGSATERRVRAVARTFVIDPAILGTLAPKHTQGETASGEQRLIALASEAVAKVAMLSEPEDQERAGVVTGTAGTVFSSGLHVRFATAEDQSAFAEDLIGEVRQLMAEYHDEESARGAWHRLMLAGYPSRLEDEPERPRGTVARAPTDEQ
jgi:DNA-binding transcriptional ArsR family regulator